jgi:hypothetical protein
VAAGIALTPDRQAAYYQLKLKKDWWSRAKRERQMRRLERLQQTHQRSNPGALVQQGRSEAVEGSLSSKEATKMQA